MLVATGLSLVSPAPGWVGKTNGDKSATCVLDARTLVSSKHGSLGTTIDVGGSTFTIASHVDHPTADIQVIKVTSDLPGYHLLPTFVTTAGTSVYMGGCGQSATVGSGYGGSGTRAERWATNLTHANTTHDIVVVNFDAPVSTANEGHATLGDSGGAITSSDGVYALAVITTNGGGTDYGYKTGGPALSEHSAWIQGVASNSNAVAVTDSIFDVDTQQAFFRLSAAGVWNGHAIKFTDEFGALWETDGPPSSGDGSTEVLFDVLSDSGRIGRSQAPGCFDMPAGTFLDAATELISSVAVIDAPFLADGIAGVPPLATRTILSASLVTNADPGALYWTLKLVFNGALGIPAAFDTAILGGDFNGVTMCGPGRTNEEALTPYDTGTAANSRALSTTSFADDTINLYFVPNLGGTNVGASRTVSVPAGTFTDGGAGGNAVVTNYAYTISVTTTGTNPGTSAPATVVAKDADGAALLRTRKFTPAASGKLAISKYDRDATFTTYVYTINGDFVCSGSQGAIGPVRAALACFVVFQTDGSGVDTGIIGSVATYTSVLTTAGVTSALTGTTSEVYLFVPSTTGSHTFTTSGTKETFIRIYDSSGSLMATVGASVTATLTAKSIYRIETYFTDSSAGSTAYSIAVSGASSGGSGGGARSRGR